jgi:acyl-CoA thioesterase-1
MKHLLFSVMIGLMVYHSSYAQDDSVRIACLGNSITHGGMGNQAYPQQLDSLLGENYDVRNFGVGGCTLLKKGDLSYWEEPALDEALEFNPDIVIILLGTNDSKPQNWIFKDEFFSDYLDLIGAFRDDDRDPIIFTAFPSPAFRLLTGIDNTIIRDEIIPMIDSVRTQAGTGLIDFYHPMVDKGYLFPDGVHPTSEGYALIARICHSNDYTGKDER